MEDLDKLLADLESTTNQFKTAYDQTDPAVQKSPAPYHPPPAPLQSPGSPVYSEIPNGTFSPSPQQPSRYVKQTYTVQQHQQSQVPAEPLYSQPHKTSFNQSAPAFNSNTPPPKPARPRVLNQPQEPTYAQPIRSKPANYQQQSQQPQQQQQQHTGNKMDNLHELDSLLQDLEAAQYQFTKAPSDVPPPKPAQFPAQGSSSKVPPAVAPKPKSPSKSKPVPYQATVSQSSQQVSQAPVSSQPQINQPAPRSASSATRELDDLMASLSDFQLSSSSPPKDSEPQYAQPMKGSQAPPPPQQVNMNGQNAAPSQKPDQPGGDQLDSMLGHLHSDVSRQGVNTVAKGHCAACNKQIVGQIVTALGKTWHPEHFVCNHCQQELGMENFFERDEKAYCENDYHNLFSPRCAYCNGAILGTCITALEQTWHPEHFFCAQCGKNFGKDGFHEKNGKAYCPEDYFDMFAPKCGGCHRAIMDNYITALNVQWHPDCFVCGECRMPFNGGSFFDHDGIPYCEIHYHAVRGSLCAGCNKPITGRCITAMQKKFHPEHFVCSYCMKQLNKGTFKEQNDKPYCHTCFEKLFS
ncbi:paxillin-like isoform X2 [Apostichopus japonicus]|uniref:paxillin-like isoform X2 n=1 Tax=Stichopus japonicus TaxID=307972 RepID=UPI003AB20F7A